MLRLTPTRPGGVAMPILPPPSVPFTGFPLHLPCYGRPRCHHPKPEARDIVRVVPCRYRCIVCPRFSKLFFPPHPSSSSALDSTAPPPPISSASPPVLSFPSLFLFFRSFAAFCTFLNVYRVRATTFVSRVNGHATVSSFIN